MANYGNRCPNQGLKKVFNDLEGNALRSGTCEQRAARRVEVYIATQTKSFESKLVAVAVCSKAPSLSSSIDSTKPPFC